MILAVVVGRVSTSEQAKGQSPDDQITLGKARITENGMQLATRAKDGRPMGETHKGLSTRTKRRKPTLVGQEPGVFMDLGVSGETFGNALVKMLEHAAARDFDVVVVWKLDRLSRVPKKQASVLDALRANKVRVYAIAEGGFISDETISAMMGLVAHRELLNIRANVKRGIVSAISKNHRVGRPPAGLQVVEKTRLVPTKLGLRVEELTNAGTAVIMIAQELGIDYHRVQRVQRNMAAFRTGQLDSYAQQLEFNEDNRAPVYERIERRKESLAKREREVRHALIDMGG